MFVPNEYFLLQIVFLRVKQLLILMFLAFLLTSMVGIFRDVCHTAKLPYVYQSALANFTDTGR